MPRKARQAIPRLGELELAVLEHLWRAGEADVAQTHAAVGKPRGITANTVGSALERLFRKKLVTRWKVSHAYRYRAALDRDGFRARALVDAAGGMRTLSSNGFLAAFVDLVADVDEQALEQLEQLIQQRKEPRE